MQYFGFDKPSFGFKTFGFGVLEWLPTELFSTGAQGAFYLPEPENLYQDAAMTVPVTANGDPVGAMMDLSGNGNSAIQTVSASRPTYQTDGILHWLEFNGVNSFLSHNYSEGNDLTTAVGIERLGGTGIQGAVFATAPGTRLSSSIVANSVNPNWGAFAGGFQSSGFSVLNNASVLVNIGEPEIPRQKLYTNGGLSASLSGTPYPGDVSNRQRIGRESDTRFLDGKIFGVVMISGAMTSENRSLLEAYLAGITGVTL